MFYIYLRTNSDLCHLQHKLIGFCNRDEKCLQRGTDWVFKQSGLRFGFKGLKGRIKVEVIVSRTREKFRPLKQYNCTFCYVSEIHTSWQD